MADEEEDIGVSTSVMIDFFEQHFTAYDFGRGFVGSSGIPAFVGVRFNRLSWV